MAEVSRLHLPEFDHDLFLDEISTFDSFSSWPHDRVAGPTSGFDHAEFVHVENGVVSSPDHKNQVMETNLVDTHEIGSNQLNESSFGVILPSEVELGLGLGFVEEGFNCVDDFYSARRREINQIMGFDVGSSRVSGSTTICIKSDSDGEDFLVENVHVDDDYLSFPLRSEEVVDDTVETNHGFEWDEVDGGADPQREGFWISRWSVEEDGDRGRQLSYLDWEVLLNFDTTIEFNVEDPMFGQFLEGEIAAGLGRLPASKAVVEQLPSVVNDEKLVCAVCRDNVGVGEVCKQLPCSHSYHADCIVPWLGIRNTCPVCRFELPTDY